MKRILILLGGLIVFVAAIVLIRAALIHPEAVAHVQSIRITFDEDQAVQRLSKALQFQTVSHQDSTQFQGVPFRELHAFLRQSFPRVHAWLKHELVNTYTLLYSWPGSDTTLRPVLLMAHQDVVPAEPGTESEWKYPPFSGAIADGFVWGRGALDDKASLVAILEGIEVLLAEGFVPKRTVYLLFGHDEEIGGMRGAREVAQLLSARGIRFEYVLDEGGIVADNIIPGLSIPVALIGIAEKGYMSLELSVNAEGGHSSMPPKHTAIGVLAKTITRIEENPFPSRTDVSDQFFDALLPHMPFFQRMALANRWLLEPLVTKQLSKSPQTNAIIRTTAAATMLSGGVKDNILPTTATAVVNFRIIPEETQESVQEYVRATLNDSRVRIHQLSFGSNPSPLSSTNSRSFNLLEQTIYEVAEDRHIVPAPYLVLAATDARHFTGLSDHVYRFIFSTFGPSDLARVHGTDERIAVQHYGELVRFYYRLLQRTTGD